MPRQMTEQERQEFFVEPHVGILSVARDSDRPPLTVPVSVARRSNSGAEASGEMFSFCYHALYRNTLRRAAEIRRSCPCFAPSHSGSILQDMILA